MTSTARQPPAATRVARATLRRPRPRPAGPARTWTIPAAAAVAAGWSLVLGVVLTGLLVVGGWIVATRGGGSFDEAVRASAIVWLAEHRIPVTVDGVRLEMLPLGFLLLPTLILHRAGRWAGRVTHLPGGLDAALLIAGASLAYGLGAAALAGLASTSSSSAVPLPALLGAGAVSVLSLGTGVLRGSGRTRGTWAALPSTVRAALRGGGIAAAALLGAGALLAALMLTLHLGEATDLAASLGAGTVGGALLALLGAGYAPVAAIWAGSYISGAGFSLGAGTHVSMTSQAQGLLPAFPWLAALPTDVSPWAPLLLVAPVSAGVIAAVALVGIGRRPGRQHMGEVVAAAFVAGLIWAGLAWLCSGAVGPDRLSEVGPVPLATGLAVTLFVGVGGCIGLAACWVTARRHRQVPFVPTVLVGGGVSGPPGETSGDASGKADPELAGPGDSVGGSAGVPDEANVRTRGARRAFGVSEAQ